MAFVLANRVQDTTTTTGTGTVTLSGTAPTGYQTFGAAIGDGNTTYYTIAAGTEWEVGIGTYASSGTTLARTTVLSSSNAGSAVNFSAGTKNVFVTYPTERTIYSGGPLGTPSSATLTNATGLPIGGITQNTARLLGRTTAAAGVTEEITLGSGLSLSAGALTSTATGTVTSVAALTLGTTGTDLSSTVATGTTTPVITLQVPTASATNRGALSSTDWSTFNGKGAGTVTSTSFTGGIVSVATATTTPALTVAGTSGGIPYFSSASTWATSAALAANALVIGGGAGVAPATTTTGTGVVTALGVNTGTAGSVVVNGGALGTPTSGTLTNATGLPVTTGLANIATASLLGRNTAGTGAVEVLSKATALTLLNTLSTFTPQLKFGGANVGMTQASTGFYIDQGSWVIGWGVISISVKGSSTGVARIYDLPFANTAAGDQAFVAISNSNLREGNYETGNWGGRPTGYMPYGESFIQLTWGNHGDGVYDTDWANNRGFNFSFFYQK